MTSRKLAWTERAESDLSGIGDFISRDDPVAARNWVRKLMAVARGAARHPFSGRRVPELLRDDVREVFLKQYRIVYQVTERHCLVLTVFEGHKRLDL